jgi:hypothetical protein
VPPPAWAAVQVLSHEHAVPRPAPLHDWFIGQEAGVPETNGQLSPSTTHVETEPVPAQNVPLPVHEASVGTQAHAALPAAPPQVWCVPQVLTVGFAVTQDCASATHVVTSLGAEQNVPAAPPTQTGGAALHWQDAPGSVPVHVWLPLGHAAEAVTVWQLWASVEQVARLPPEQNVPDCEQPAGSGLHLHRPVDPSQVSFAVQAVVVETTTQLCASRPQWTDELPLQASPTLPTPRTKGQTLGAGLHVHEAVPFGPVQVWFEAQLVA